MPHDLLLEPVVHTSRSGAVVSIAGDPRGPIVAIAAQRQVLLYNTQTLELTGVLPFPEGFPEVVKFSRDGHLVIAGGGIGAKSGHVVVWDVVTGKRLMEAGDEFDEVLAADISPDHHYIALGGPGKMVKIFKDGKLAFSLKKHTDWIMALAFTSDGKMLISGDRQGGLEVWEVATGGEMFMLPAHKAGVTAISAPAPQACITASEDGTVKMWDLREGKEVKSWNAHNSGTLSAAFAQDGTLVTCGRDKQVRLWNRDGGKIRDLGGFDDVALSAAMSQGRVVASDWSGTIYVWDADGKRLAELTPDPPTLAERVTAGDARIVDLKSRSDQASAALINAVKAAEKSGEDSRAAIAAAADKEKEVKAGETQLAALGKILADASDALKKAGTDYAQLQTTGQNLAADLAKAQAANDTAIQDQKVQEGGMQDRQKKADQLAEAAKTAQAAADKQSDNKDLADTAAKAKADADKAQEDVIADQKAATARDADVQKAKDVLAAARDAMSNNKDAQHAAQQKVDEQTAAVDKMKTDLAAATDGQGKLKGAFDEFSKGLAPKAADADAAAQKLAKARQESEALAHDLAQAKGDLLKWKAAQVNVTLYAARKTLEDAAHEASAELDKAHADLAATEKGLAQGPDRIIAGAQAIAQAHAMLDKANTDAAAAKDVVTHKELLLQASADFAAKLAAESTQTPDDSTIKDAAAKATETGDLLKRDIATAHQTADARDAAVKQAQNNVTAAEKALVDTKGDIEAAPATIEKLKTSIDEIAKRTADARAAADKKAADAHLPVAEAQQKVDAISHDYQAANQQALAALTPSK
jgi:hypothetical protein